MHVRTAQRWMLRAGAILLPLTYWPLTYDHYVLPKLLLARSLVLALAVLLIIRWLAGGAVVIKRTALDLPLLAFLASALISAVVGINLNLGLFGTYTRYDGALTLITYAALFWLSVQALEDSKDAQGVLRALLVGAYLVALLAIGQWFVDTLAGSQVPRAFGTLGNSNVLGAYLVMLIPFAYHELRGAASAGRRLLAANVLGTMGLAVVMSVSHSAWLGLAVAAVILIAGRQYPVLSFRRQFLFGLAGLAILAAVAPIALSRSTVLTQRVGIWGDSIPLIASSPIFGYGPDTFGLVFPRFQSAPWVYYTQIDKAHSELLQVAATQGLLGLAILLWILAAFALAFWRGRTHRGAWPLFAGWAAYQVVMMVNFTALGSAFPFWIFAAASMLVWGATREVRWVPERARVPATAAGMVLTAGALALALPAVAMPYLADQRLQQAVVAQWSLRASDAARLAASARALNPQESVYAVEGANVAFDDQDWVAARAAYLDAIWLGTFSPRLYRNLAIADSYLGLRAEAIAAARQAVYLDRWDPANQALLAQMEIGGS
jgi:putative inorganic carbon (HCO3(-)) transporter